MTTTSYKVTGMSCEHCVNAVTSELRGLDGVSAVTVDLVPDGVSLRDGHQRAPAGRRRGQRGPRRGRRLPHRRRLISAYGALRGARAGTGPARPLRSCGAVPGPGPAGQAGVRPAIASSRRPERASSMRARN